MNVSQATEIIKQGGIGIFPTDTAFGIGCRVDNAESVKRLFEIRRRPGTQATPVLFDKINQVKEYTLPFDSRVESLMQKYWPGALTIVLDCITEKVSPLVRGEGKTLGVRIPDHKTILELISGAGIPILGPSANFHGDETPFNFESLNPELVKLVDFVLPGETKGTGFASTVVDCSKEPWDIIRQGSVYISE